MRVYPSLAAADQGRLAEALLRVAQGQPDGIHLDLEDGLFVPNLTFGWHTIRDLRPLTALPFDVHLMMAQPEPHLPAICAAGADRIAVHVEACPYPRRVVEQIRRLGATPGLALNPATPLDAALPAMDRTGYLLLLTNEYDGEARFIPHLLPRIRQAVAMARGFGVPVVVDGGVTLDLARDLALIGVDGVVAGRAVLGADDPAGAIAAFRTTGREGA